MKPVASQPDRARPGEEIHTFKPGTTGSKAGEAIPAKPAATPASKAAAKILHKPLPLKDFAGRAVAAAHASPTGGFGTEKTFISHAKAQLANDPHIAKMSDSEFKARLLEAHKAGYLELGRADLVGSMSPHDVTASSTKHMNVDYHFIRHPEKTEHAPKSEVLKSRVAGARDESERRKIIAEHVERNLSPAKDVHAPGTDAPARLRQIEHEGVKYHFPDSPGRGGQSPQGHWRSGVQPVPGPHLQTHRFCSFHGQTLSRRQRNLGQGDRAESFVCWCVSEGARQGA